MKNFKTKDLVAAWNRNNTRQIKKFSTRKVAEAKIRGLAAEMGMSVEKIVGAAPVVNVPDTREKHKGVLRATHEPWPAKQVVAAREGTNHAILIDLLSGDGGATLEDIKTAFEKAGRTMKDSSIRPTINWMTTTKGYGLRTEGKRFFLVYPPGMTGPLAHTKRKSK